ncbi:hypothetical protein JXB27_00825 [Candidatus Woesearchaeota archaeon]|nr:hypothetical protein [Candidatus Woesearchaeota archaeon]
MKKSQIEVQFNWIFVLIVGAILLTFFVTIALKQKSTSETIIKSESFDAFNTILSSISSPEGSATSPVKFSDDIGYYCIIEDPCICQIYSGKRTQPSALLFTDDLFIFSQENLKGLYKIVSSKEWTFPFRIANFIFIISPEIKYFIEDTFFGQTIFYGMPPETILEEDAEYKAVDKELFNPNEFSITSGNYKVRFVFTETNPEDFSIPEEIRGSDTDVSAVYFTTENSADVVKFYKKSKSDPSKFSYSDESFIFGDATTYAAIFSENKDDYACMMNNAFKRFMAAAEIMKEKQIIYRSQEQFGCSSENTLGLESIQTEVSSSVCCTSYDTHASSSLLKISIDMFNLQDYDSYLSVKREISALNSQNDNAVRNGCPNLY